MVDNLSSPDDPRIEASIDIAPKGGSGTFEDLTFQEIILGESLLTPGLQTSVIMHSYMHSVKNFDLLKKGTLTIRLNQPTLAEYGIKKTDLFLSQIIYRMQDRSPLDNNNEQLTMMACDPSMLFDAENLVSKSWKCTTPDEIVKYVLQSCVGANKINVEGCGSARDYIAENIHPFQVIQQQAGVALANGTDPSFLHFMTYEDGGTHKFQSLYNMVRQSPVMTFTNAEVGSIQGIRNPRAILAYSFPCDFDLLTDLLNGLDEDGKDISSLIVFNPLKKMFSLVGNQKTGCGVGGGNPKLAPTNRNSAEDQNSCNDNVEQFLQKRQARMNLVAKDKIALRLTVPWNPTLNAGKVIRIKLTNGDNGNMLNYGSGDYLILHLTHNIKRGGYSTTTMDCVSNTVGKGIV